MLELAVLLSLSKLDEKSVVKPCKLKMALKLAQFHAILNRLNWTYLRKISEQSQNHDTSARTPKIERNIIFHKLMMMNSI